MGDKGTITTSMTLVTLGWWGSFLSKANIVDEDDKIMYTIKTKGIFSRKTTIGKPSTGTLAEINWGWFGDDSIEFPGYAVRVTDEEPNTSWYKNVHGIQFIPSKNGEPSNSYLLGVVASDPLCSRIETRGEGGKTVARMKRMFSHGPRGNHTTTSVEIETERLDKLDEIAVALVYEEGKCKSK